MSNFERRAADMTRRNTKSAIKGYVNVPLVGQVAWGT